MTIKEKQELSNAAAEVDAIKSKMIEERLSQSYSSIRMVQDYLSMLTLEYNKRTDDALLKLHLLLFGDGALIHLDELLDATANAIDDALVYKIDKRENNE